MNATQILSFVGSPTNGEGKESVAHYQHANGARSRAYRAAVRHMVQGWAEYADACKREYDSTIGDDGFLGPAWKDIGTALLTLLNGELGGFDGGSLDANIRNFAAQHGVNLND